jgi:hypothetical protein
VAPATPAAAEGAASTTLRASAGWTSSASKCPFSAMTCITWPIGSCGLGTELVEYTVVAQRHLPHVREQLSRDIRLVGRRSILARVASARRGHRAV